MITKRFRMLDMLKLPEHHVGSEVVFPGVYEPRRDTPATYGVTVVIDRRIKRNISELVFRVHGTGECYRFEYKTLKRSYKYAGETKTGICHVLCDADPYAVNCKRVNVLENHFVPPGDESWEYVE